MSAPTGPVAGPAIVELSGKKFILGCAVVAGVILGLGLAGVWTPTAWVLAGEVFATIIALFVLGSIKYRLNKNALTYGAALVIVATFAMAGTAETAGFHKQVAEHGWGHFVRHNLLSFHGLDKLVHADTMLFILGLTFFVAVIAQTRLLEWTTMIMLRRWQGWVLPTIISVTVVVSLASGILDGVSMIGLTIRTLVIILMVAAAPTSSIRYAVMVCTAVTTVCGMWLAYGEPPNLIMKANVVVVNPDNSFGANGAPWPVGKQLLNDAFFLRYCLPAAVAAYLCVAFNLRRKLKGVRVPLDKMDVLDRYAATVRFLQAQRHGEVLTPIEFIENHETELAGRMHGVIERMRKGELMGAALVNENVPVATRQMLLGKFVAEDLAQPLDDRYALLAKGDVAGAERATATVLATIDRLKPRRLVAQQIGALALVPFIGLLVAHALNHAIPLFLASFAGFLVAFLGIANLPKIRKLALHEGRHEYAEYYFLFPLFLSITLLADIGFFNQLQTLIQHGVETAGATVVAWLQFAGCTVLSAMLDNNVVADFASRALLSLPDVGLIHLFAMAQIAGYAAGGCWTHIGSAQSVVAYSFIQRDVDETYTPFQWIKEMTPVILSIVAVLTVVIVLEGALLKWLH
jgi:Na+/H+ antiporter NhaD/arsenite permease-like protein